MGNESRKGKKSNSEKPKQAQRGLGVAQLEKMIRLHGQTGYSSMASSSSSSTSSASHGFIPSMMMGHGEYDKRQNIRYGDSRPSTIASWNPENVMLDGTQHFVQPIQSQTRQLLNLHYVEDSPPKKEQETTEQLNMGSDGRNSESSDTQELDLELRLSL